MKTKLICTVALTGAAVAFLTFRPAAPISPEGSPSAPLPAAPESALAAGTPEEPAPTAPAVRAPAEQMDLDVALEQKVLAAEFTGNGKDQLRMEALNKGGVPLQIRVNVGQVFESGGSALVVLRTAEVEVDPGRTCELILETAAVRSTNQIAPALYQLTKTIVPRIELLLTFIQGQPELSHETIQTAILALTDNLPLSAVAKFQMAGGTLPSRFDTDAFRVNTLDLIEALTLLRELGVPEASIAMTIDPQLRIESMIDPETRPVAMAYFDIKPELEWEFWRSELLSGEPCTRHYALYGIARFYPEVALQMLPKWVMERRTNPVYRLSAVQALADTQRPEALPILHGLVEHLGARTELGKAAVGAAEYLDYRLSQIAEEKSQMAFQQAETPRRF